MVVRRACSSFRVSIAVERCRSVEVERRGSGRRPRVCRLGANESGLENQIEMQEVVGLNGADQNPNTLIRPICITILYHNLLLFIDIFHI